MSKTVKVGDVYVEVPDDSPLDAPPGAEPPPLTAERPLEQEKLESRPWTYRPNDAFQSNIDGVVALGNLGTVGKPWVRKAFVVFFLIIPFLACEILAFTAMHLAPEGQKMREFLRYNAFAVIACGPYLLIWWAMRRKRAS